MRSGQSLLLFSVIAE
jgi:hypothetical protein